MGEEDSIETRAPAPSQGHTHLKVEKIFLSICLFAILFLALLSSLWTASPIGLTILGYLPTIIVIVLLLVLLEQDFKQGVYWGVAFMVCILFLAIFGLLNPLLSNTLSIVSLTVINLVISLIIVLILTFIEGRSLLPKHVEAVIEFEPEKLDEYIHSIEDKCKAMNFVIGRVYRSSNGGSDKMRARLRIDKDWYNEFNQHIEEGAKEAKHEAITLLNKIHDRLLLLSKKEDEVFSAAELKGLKHLQRDPHGKDAIIDVLTINDRDPVQHYYVGALEGAQLLLEHLKKL